MSKIWFTADTHFGHQNIIRHCDRPWATADEMNRGLVDAWNRAVRPDDIVWHLGDVFGREENWDVVDELNGHIHVIAGNHDAVWNGNRDGYKRLEKWLRHFESVSMFGRRKIGGREVLLSHFPYDGDHTETDRHAQYRLKDLGAPLLCGHVHELWRSHGRMLNVGVDVNDYRPVALDEIARWVAEIPR